MQRFFVAIALVPLLGLLAVGCSFMSSVFSEPDWSENYALKGECDIPELNDGSMYSTGKTHSPQYVRGEQADDSRFTDAVITLKEPKDIKRITIRRRTEDSVPVDINIFGMVDGRWKPLAQMRGKTKDDININVSAVTDKVRIRMQRATRTADGKAAIAKSSSGRSGGRGRSSERERLMREPIMLAEIELYGLKAKAES